MKRCWAILSFVLALSPVAACAQVGVYGSVAIAHFDNNNNHQSEWFYGPCFGAYYDFLHFGPISAGIDLRGNFLYGSNDRYRSGQAGVRVAAKLPVLSLKPYVLGAIGAGGTKSVVTGFNPGTSVSTSNAFTNSFLYQIAGGVDTRLLPHVDLRVIDVGYTRLTAVSSLSNLPASAVITLGSGIVLRF
jgi:hypothetical protein